MIAKSQGKSQFLTTLRLSQLGFVGFVKKLSHEMQLVWSLKRWESIERLLSHAKKTDNVRFSLFADV